jgi:phenylalanine-4-hydroxylase
MRNRYQIDPTIESNRLIDRLPPHLKQFIKPQEYESYTPIDQAVWRYVMRKNVNYLSEVAHESYLGGLKMTGIDVESIPSMYGMNRILKEIGWAAVAVDGFIPPNAFMEFQAYKVLVIASDIRQIDNIQYTPAPDIIHEAAGHAPIIANPDYAEYLRRLGAIGAKAILSSYDHEVYEAVRRLSILEESLGVDPKDLAEARDKVMDLQAMKVPFSEMAQMRNLQWWTVEYGLIGSMKNPRIYGAGLLSSIGESEWCMSDQVKKIPYSLAAAHQGFDITKPQPQLFVTPSFPYLMEVLESFSNSLAVRRGGAEGLNKLIESTQVGTIELNSGVQVSGMFDQMEKDSDGNVAFFSTKGQTTISFRDKELVGHGIEEHPFGICAPIGKLKGINLAIEDMSPLDLSAYGINDRNKVDLEFESGIKIAGQVISNLRNVKGKLMVIEFRNAKVYRSDQILFESGEHPYFMVIGTKVVSAYAGAADADAFPNIYHESETKTIKPVKTDAKTKLESLYEEVKAIRASKKAEYQDRVSEIFDIAKNDYPEDWLLSVELLELAYSPELTQAIESHLEKLSNTMPKKSKLIEDGLRMVHDNLGSATLA